MNIHEYQAKDLFAEFAVPIPAGVAVSDLAELPDALAKLPAGKVVVKAQIHAGGRGKGTFTDGFQGGVKIANDAEEATEFATRMLNNTLVTIQTGPAGRLVRTLYLAEPVDIAKEYYLAILLDRATSTPVIIASTEGGVDIEEVAAKTPEKITHVHVDPTIGIQAYQAREVAFSLGFEGQAFKECVKLVMNLYRLFWEKEAALVEVNPLILTTDGHLQALDAKVSFDEGALYRHPEIQALRDLGEEDPKEVEAGKAGLSYIALDGNIACLVNGAGLAMATMDIIKHFGGNPANFLDVGGGATEEQVTEAFRIILSDPNVKGILVNIFGGIMKCDIIARGILGAVRSTSLSVPLVVRLEGTNVEEGRAILAGSDLQIVTAETLSEAAKKIVDLVAKA